MNVKQYLECIISFSTSYLNFAQYIYFVYANSAFFRAYINTAQNLLNIAPRGSIQGVFRALTHRKERYFE